MDEAGIRLLVVADDAEAREAFHELLNAGSLQLSLEWAGGGEAPARPRREPAARQRLRFARRLPVRLPGDRLLFLKSEEIDWIEAANQYVRIRAGTDRYLMRESMNRLESRLDPRRFARIHRSTIVNLERIRLLRTRLPGGRWAELDDGSRLEVSQGRWETLQRAMLDLA